MENVTFVKNLTFQRRPKALVCSKGLKENSEFFARILLRRITLRHICDFKMHTLVSVLWCSLLRIFENFRLGRDLPASVI